MSVLTRLDERLRADIRRGRLICTYFCLSGQEAVAAGVAAALRPDDLLVATYRGLQLQVAKGMPIRQVVGEMVGSSGWQLPARAAACMWPGLNTA